MGGPDSTGPPIAASVTGWCRLTEAVVAAFERTCDLIDQRFGFLASSCDEATFEIGRRECRANDGAYRECDSAAHERLILNHRIQVTADFVRAITSCAVGASRALFKLSRDTLHSRATRASKGLTRTIEIARATC